MRLFLVVVVVALVLGAIYHAQIGQRVAETSAYLSRDATPLGGAQQLGRATGGVMTGVGNALSS